MAEACVEGLNVHLSTQGCPDFDEVLLGSNADLAVAFTQAQAVQFQQGTSHGHSFWPRLPSPPVHKYNLRVLAAFFLAWTCMTTVC